MIRILILPALALSIAGCDLPALEGKPSKFQQYQQRIAALEARAPVVERVIERVEYVPAVEVVEPAPEPIPEPEPECVPVFREVVCP